MRHIDAETVYEIKVLHWVLCVFNFFGTNSFYVKVRTPNWCQKEKEKKTMYVERKLKHFLLQCLTGCVALCSRLSQLHCGNERSCPLCGGDHKSVNHFLFECHLFCRRGYYWTCRHFHEFSWIILYIKTSDFLMWAPARGVLTQSLAKFHRLCGNYRKQGMINFSAE